MKERDALVSGCFVLFRLWRSELGRRFYVKMGSKKFKTPQAAKAARTRWEREGIAYLNKLKGVMLYA